MPWGMSPIPHTSVFHVGGEGIMLAISLVLHSLNKLYAPERCITLCFAFSLVRDINLADIFSHFNSLPIL